MATIEEVEEMRTWTKTQFFPLGGFYAAQADEISLGFKHGLSAEQVAVYADPKLDDQQMFQIRKGLEQGLTAEQIVPYADTELSGYQLREICRGLLDGLSAEQVAEYARPELSPTQMFEFYFGFKNGLSGEQINEGSKNCIAIENITPKEGVGLVDAVVHEAAEDAGVFVHIAYSYDARGEYEEDSEAINDFFKEHGFDSVDYYDWHDALPVSILDNFNIIEPELLAEQNLEKILHRHDKAADGISEMAGQAETAVEEQPGDSAPGKEQER